jgi:hypothetical protein
MARAGGDKKLSHGSARDLEPKDGVADRVDGGADRTSAEKEKEDVFHRDGRETRRDEGRGDPKNTGAPRAASGARERENLDRRKDWKGVPGPTTAGQRRCLAKVASAPERRGLSGGGLRRRGAGELLATGWWPWRSGVPGDATRRGGGLSGAARGGAGGGAPASPNASRDAIQRPASRLSLRSLTTLALCFELRSHLIDFVLV